MFTQIVSRVLKVPLKIRLSVRADRTMSSFPESCYKVDRFRCVQIDIGEVLEVEGALELPAFEQHLQESLRAWESDGLRGVWCRVPIGNSAYIPSLVKSDFVYHHAKPSSVKLVKWISEEPNNIPSYPYTNIGVGGVVVDDQDRVLVVKEKYFIGKKLWKFPGGYASQGENFYDTAEREVFEETGVKVKFQSLIALRHMHKFQFDCSDIYAVCYLKPTGSLELTKCPHEIAEVQWIKIDDVIGELSDFNRLVLQKYRLAKETGISMSVENVNHVLGGKTSVYALKRMQEEDSAANKLE